MVVYEVNLTVQTQIEDAFGTWLSEHIEDMLKIDGFSSATWFERRPEDEGAQAQDTVLWTVHYELASRAHLEAYMRDHAAQMRADGVERFGDAFTASRRVLGIKRMWIGS